MSERACRLCRTRFPVAATGRRRIYCSTACRMAAWRKRNRRLRGTREILGSSRSVEWPTDPGVFAELDREFEFDLDPCATPENAKCERYFTEAENGLAQTWTGRVFMNPPYGRDIGAWMAKAWEASQTTATLVCCLVPSRTDTAWWHEYAERGEVRFLRGRLRFGGSENSAPFPSAVVVFRNAPRVTKA